MENHLEFFWFLPLAPPFFNSLVNIIDIYFAKGVYENEWDGAAISCLFKGLAIPLIFLYQEVIGGEGFLFQSLYAQEASTRSLAFLGGVLYSLSSLFYFKAIMSGSNNDVVLVESFFNLNAVLVPLGGMILLGQLLYPQHWFGITLAIAGAVVVSLWGQGFVFSSETWLKISSMTLAAGFLSAGMIAEDFLYKRADFLPVFCVFSLGCFWSGLIFSLVRSIKKMQSLWIFCRRFLLVFFLMESLELVAMFFQEITISLLPAFYVSTAYCLQPVFVLVFSLLICLLSPYSIRFLSFANYRKFCALTDEMKNEQWANLGGKLVGTIILALGIILFYL